MSYGRRTLDMIRAAGQQNAANVNSGIAGFGGRMTGGAAGMIGKASMTIPGGYAILGGAAAAMSHDPSKNSFASHMAQEGLKIGADAAFDVGLFGTVGRMGGVGMGIAMVGSIAMHTLGLNPGEVVQKYMNKAGDAYKKERGMGPTPISQNQRTMRATQQGMNLLRQSRGAGAQGHSMLGSEAQFMHN